MTSPAFQRTRENMNEMRGVGFYVKQLRTSLDLFLPYVSDPIVTGRLMRAVKKSQLQSIGTRGERPLDGANLVNQLVAERFEVSEVYKVSQALRGALIDIADGATSTPAEETFTVSFLAGQINFPTGANCVIPIVTTIECDDVAFQPTEDAWDAQHIDMSRRISRNIIMDGCAISFVPSSSITINYFDESISLNEEDTNHINKIDYGITLQKNSDEFGRVLVWVGFQFGQLVQESATGYRFVPLRGATAGYAAASLQPNPAG